MALPNHPPSPFMDWLQQAADCKSLRFTPLLAIAFLFAALGFWFGPARATFAGEAPNLATVTLCIWIAWLWAGVFASALVLHGPRALWLAPGAPFALIWPLLQIVQTTECSWTGCL